MPVVLYTAEDNCISGDAFTLDLHDQIYYALPTRIRALIKCHAMQKLNKYKFEYDKPHEEFLDSLSKPFPAGTNDAKKLGEYLLQEDFCSKDTIDLAVEAQQTLQKRGVYKPLGKIMVESDYIDPGSTKMLFVSPMGRHSLHGGPFSGNPAPVGRETCHDC